MRPSVTEQHYGTPPELPPQVSPEERAAIDSVRGRIRLFTSTIATGVSAVFGAMIGAIWGHMSGSRFWTKTAGAAVVSALGGLILSNLTWIPHRSHGVMTRHVGDAIDPPLKQPSATRVSHPEPHGTVGAEQMLQR